MGRYIGPKNKIAKKDQPLEERKSDYGRALHEKQRLKRRYGLREKQFKKLYESSLKQAQKSSEHTTGELLLQATVTRVANSVLSLIPVILPFKLSTRGSVLQDIYLSLISLFNN